MKILADAHIPFLKGVAEQLGEVEYLPGNQFTPQVIKDKDVLIVRTVTHFGENNMADSNVKLICSATIGFDHIDTAYCESHNIGWRTAPGCNANSVEQYITSTLLLLADKYQFNLEDKTIGIVGVGNVGRKVEAACRKLGMRVLLNDPPREEKEFDNTAVSNSGIVQNIGMELNSTNKLNSTNEQNPFVDLETIKREADIITFHTPLIKEGKHRTFHLADEKFFMEVARKPFIINAARGGVTCNTALKKAIKEEQVSGVVLDCWENEPNIDLELLKITEIATPHIAGYSADGKWNATQISIQNIIDYFKIDIKPNYQTLPSPKAPIIDLKGVQKDRQLAVAVWHTYTPLLESRQLKETPNKFYWFRSNYPLRREYNAYKLINADTEIAGILKKLGFK